jgi:hypothetical protein
VCFVKIGEECIFGYNGETRVFVMTRPQVVRVTGSK